MLSWAYPGSSSRRDVAVGLYAVASPLGFVVGGVVASLFAEKASWPFAFWTLAALCVTLAAVGLVVLPEREKQKRETTEGTAGLVGLEERPLWLRLDAVGTLLLICAVVLVNVGIGQARLVSWANPYTYSLLAVGVAAAVAFVYVQAVSPSPLVPVRALTPPAGLVLGCFAAGWGSFGVWAYYSLQFVETQRGWSPLLASAALAPGLVSAFLASLLASLYLVARVRLFWLIFVAMVGFCLASLLLATAPSGQAFFGTAVLGILSAPVGMVLADPATLLMDDSVSRDQQAVAGGLVAMLAHCSISAAIALAGLIESSVAHGTQGPLARIRAAQLFGLGLAGLAVLLAAAFLVTQRRRGALASAEKGVG
jgi:MFS family permease